MIPEVRFLDRDADRKVVARDRGVSKIADDLYLKSKVSSFRHGSIDEGTISSRERANDAVYGEPCDPGGHQRKLGPPH